MFPRAPVRLDDPVTMPQRECLEIHEWSLDDPTDDVFWQAGYKPEPPISDEERLRWMAANAAEGRCIRFGALPQHIGAVTGDELVSIKRPPCLPCLASRVQRSK